MRYLLLFMLMLLPPASWARTLGEVQLPDTLQVGSTTLVLNGAGIRSKYFMDVYVAGLYLPRPQQDAAAIIAADEVQAIRLLITSSHITRTRLLDSIEEGIQQSAGKDFPRFQPRLRELEQALTFDVKIGDQYDFIWLPDKGIQVYRNDTALRVIESLGFKQVLFGIWLGQDPVQDSLKRDLLPQ